MPDCSSKPPRHIALIPAAGVGARMKGNHPKQYLTLAGKPMIRHAMDVFASHRSIDHLYVVVGNGDGYIDDVIANAPHLQGRLSILRCGGATRQESVLNGLHAIQENVSENDWVLVHDAARPGLTGELIDRLINQLGSDPIGGLLALPVVDTVKRADEDGRTEATVPRDRLWMAQTPQMFRYSQLKQALHTVEQVTDEASAMEALGLRPRLVEGSHRNFKITLPQDMLLAELYFKEF